MKRTNLCTQKLPILKSQRIFILGAGSIGKSVLYYLDRFFDLDFSTSVVIVDKNPEEAKFPSVQEALQRGATFLVYEIETEKLDEFFDQIIQANKYDVIIDLTTRTQTFDIFKKVRERGLLYINTSIEDDRDIDSYVEQTIFVQHMNLKNLDLKLRNYSPTTTLIEYGMNPGLISTFVRYGIKNLTFDLLRFQEERGILNEELFDAYQINNYGKMAKILGIEVIHCSEIDTQSHRNKKDNRFLNTWSCLGMIDEGIDSLEITLGTHEDKSKILPLLPSSNFYDQLLVINQPCYQVKCRSASPLKIGKNGSIEFTQIIGRCVHHGESSSLNRFLSDEKYSPTIHYVYQTNPATDKFLESHSKEELVQLGEKIAHQDWHVMNLHEDGLDGYDNVGALFILRENPFTGNKEPYLYWSGSILDTCYTKKVLKDPYFGPTSIQVTAGIMAGLSYILQNKERGLIFGEDLPEDYVLNKVGDMLGTIYSGPVDPKIKLDTHLHNLLV